MGSTMTELFLPVGEVAKATGVTIRTLHHYDQIGLLRPSRRSEAGYRLYDEADLERLQQVLFYRELGFALREIQSILSDSGIDAMAHFRRQHELLTEHIDRLTAMVAAIEQAMEVKRMGISLTAEERFEVFGDFKPEEFEAEVEERWGGSDAYVESQRRTSAYTGQDWLRIKSEGAELDSRLADALRAGVKPHSQDAMDIAEAHRQQIIRNFYDCSNDMHRGLGEMYVSDPRFKARYEEIAPGLAEFLRDAIRANAERSPDQSGKG